MLSKRIRDQKKNRYLITTWFNKAFGCRVLELLQVPSDKTIFSGGTASTIPKKRPFIHLTMHDKKPYSIQDYIKTRKRKDICRRDSPAYREAAVKLVIKNIIKETENCHKEVILSDFVLSINSFECMHERVEE